MDDNIFMYDTHTAFQHDSNMACLLDNNHFLEIIRYIKVRFDDRAEDGMTSLKFMTDGCLLREFLKSQLLDAYDVIVLDEAHERSLSTDILFSLVKRASHQRRKRWERFSRSAKAPGTTSPSTKDSPLKVVVMSATLDTVKFSKYFDECPVLDCPGKLWPIEIFYDQPVAAAKRVEAAVNCALNLHIKESRGHVLAFLTGKEECEQACTLAVGKLEELIRKKQSVADCLIVPLYGSLTTDEQRKVFAKVGGGGADGGGGGGAGMGDVDFK